MMFNYMVMKYKLDWPLDSILYTGTEMEMIIWENTETMNPN